MYITFEICCTEILFQVWPFFPPESASQDSFKKKIHSLSQPLFHWWLVMWPNIDLQNKELIFLGTLWNISFHNEVKQSTALLPWLLHPFLHDFCIEPCQDRNARNGCSCPVTKERWQKNIASCALQKQN